MTAGIVARRDAGAGGGVCRGEQVVAVCFGPAVIMNNNQSDYHLNSSQAAPAMLAHPAARVGLQWVMLHAAQPQ